MREEDLNRISNSIGYLLGRYAHGDMKVHFVEKSQHLRVEGIERFDGFLLRDLQERNFRVKYARVNKGTHLITMGLVQV